MSNLQNNSAAVFAKRSCLSRRMCLCCVSHALVILQVPGGLRMGAPALTSRGFVESDFRQVADFVHRCFLHNV